MFRSNEKGKKSKTSPEYLPKKYQELIEYHSQKPYFAEPYRTLRTNLHLLNSHNPLKTLLVTSSEPAEGKTTILVNLAISFSEEGKSVLIIDSDLRKPKIHKFFEIESYPGLTEILLGSKKLEEVIKNINTHFNVIVSGSLPKDPLKLLGTPMMKDFVNSLKPKFDVILFDSPPVLSAADAVLISKFVDGVIFVLNSGFVKEDIVKRAKERFEKFKVNVLGMVMNRFDAKKHGESYNPYDRYYYISR
jgi:capsular exopolysaccharide synthesis family protein